MSNTIKVRRITSDTLFNGKHLVAGIQLTGGTAVTALYDDTSAVAASKVANVTSPNTAPIFFDPPIYVSNLYVDLGLAVSEALVYFA